MQNNMQKKRNRRRQIIHRRYSLVGLNIGIIIRRPQVRILLPLFLVLFPISYFLFPISYFLFPISYFLFPISYFLFPISWYNFYLYSWYTCYYFCKWNKKDILSFFVHSFQPCIFFFQPSACNSQLCNAHRGGRNFTLSAPTEKVAIGTDPPQSRQSQWRGSSCCPAACNSQPSACNSQLSTRKP